MKNLKIVLATGFIALLVSCGPAKETTSVGAKKDTVTNSTQNRGRSNQDVSANRQSNANRNSNRNATAAGSRTSNTDKSPTRNAEAVYKANMQKMYSDLNMSNEQVKSFESKWTSNQNSWKRNNPNKTMNNYETIEYQDRILNQILDENQFESYRQWVIDNPNKN